MQSGLYSLMVLLVVYSVHWYKLAYIHEEEEEEAFICHTYIPAQ